MGLLLKHLQIIRHRIRELLVVLTVGMVDIPICFPVVIPDVGIDPIAEVRVAGLLFPENVGKIQKQHIHLAFVPIQNGNAKGMVLICDDPRDELDLCPIQLIETHIAGPAYIGGVRILWGNDFVKLLFEKVHIPSLDADNAPEIHGRSEGKHEAGKQDGGSRPLELAGFSVLEVGGAQLGKEEDGQNQVDGGKHHIVDHRLDLGGCGGPGTLDGAGHISGTGGKSCGRHQAGHCQDHDKHNDQALIVEFTHRFPPLCY